MTGGPPSPAAAAAAVLPDRRFLAGSGEVNDAEVNGEINRDWEVTEELLLLLPLLLLPRRVCRGMDAWRIG